MKSDKTQYLKFLPLWINSLAIYKAGNVANQTTITPIKRWSTSCVLEVTWRHDYRTQRGSAHQHAITIKWEAQVAPTCDWCTKNKTRPLDTTTYYGKGGEGLSLVHQTHVHYICNNWSVTNWGVWWAVDLETSHLLIDWSVTCL